MRTIAMPASLSRENLLKKLQNFASYLGLGLISIQDPDYLAILEAYRTISLAYRHSDFPTVAKTLDRDYFILRPDGIRLDRSEVDTLIRHRLDTQIETDYREEPAHIVMRGNRAKVASRVYSKTICRRSGQLVELSEMAEHLTLWRKSASGWKRIHTQIRHHEQNTEWIPESVDATPEVKRAEKFVV